MSDHKEDEGLDLAFPANTPSNESFEELGRRANRVASFPTPARRRSALGGRMGSLDARIAERLSDNKRALICRACFVLGAILSVFLVVGLFR